MNTNVKAIGRLMRESEYEALGLPDHYTPVFDDVVNNNVMITLKPLSKLPDPFGYPDKVMVQCDRLDSSLLKYDITEIANRLDGKYIVFRPVGGDPDVLGHDQRFLGNVPIIEEDYYIPIPIFDLDSIGITIEEFEHRVSKMKPFNAAPAVSDTVEDKPEIIIVKYGRKGSKRHSYIVYGNIQHFVIRDYATYMRIYEPEQNRTEFNDGEYVIEDKEDGICFVPYHIVGKYSEFFSYNDVGDIYSTGSSGNDSELNKAPMKKGQPDNISVKEKSVSVENEISVVHKEEKAAEEPDQIPTVKNEAVMGQIERIKSYARKSGLLYDNTDIANFLVSADSFNFIILAGMSGTGKSKLVKNYGKSLGIDEYDGIKFISVSPSWTDDSDILGYVDYKAMKFREADTELVSFLKEAAMHRDKKYIVCFDELNLARVEHYFSQFLSILEDDEEEREFIVYNKNLKSELVNSEDYPPSIRLYDNVVFVGTINIDDSTFNLSDKVLDRANVIKLNTLPFIMLKEVDSRFVLTNDELEFLYEVHELINNQNPKLGIGYRIVRHINKYISRIPENISFGREEAFDKLVTQRIITKIRGSEEQVGTLIGYVSQNNTLIDSGIENILDRYENISKFESVRKELLNKARELKLYGYTV